jgi:hypothetical protein
MKVPWSVFMVSCAKLHLKAHLLFIPKSSFVLTNAYYTYKLHIHDQ